MIVSDLSPKLQTTAAPGSLQQVTCIVVTYNGLRYIGNCLQSLLETSTLDQEVIVVDNQSSDGTAGYVREHFPAVRVIECEANLGYGEANNRGARAGRGKYVAIVNQDATATPGWLNELIAALEADAAVGLATPKILQRERPDRINTCGNAPHFTGITPCRGFDAPADTYLHSETVGAVSGAAFVLRRELFEALGGFDGSFFLYLEDTDLSLRALLAGYRSVCVATSIVVHDFEPRFAPDKLFYLERNRYQMLLKLYRWRTLVALLPALALSEIAVWGYALLRGPGALRSKARAWWWVLSRLSLVLEKRRQTQAQRKVADRTILRACEPTIDLRELGLNTGGFAMAVLNPLFAIWYRLLLAVVHW